MLQEAGDGNPLHYVVQVRSGNGSVTVDGPLVVPYFEIQEYGVLFDTFPCFFPQ